MWLFRVVEMGEKNDVDGFVWLKTATYRPNLHNAPQPPSGFWWLSTIRLMYAAGGVPNLSVLRMRCVSKASSLLKVSARAFGGT
jgi:hypothetical protein